MAKDDKDDSIGPGGIAGIFISCVALVTAVYLVVKESGTDTETDASGAETETGSSGAETETGSSGSSGSNSSARGQVDSFQKTAIQSQQNELAFSSLPPPNVVIATAQNLIGNISKELSKQANAIQTASVEAPLKVEDTTSTSSAKAEAPLNLEAKEAEKKDNYKYKNIAPPDFTTQMENKSIDELKGEKNYLEQKFKEKNDAESKMSNFSWGKVNPNRTKASEVNSHLDIVKGLIDKKKAAEVNPVGNESYAPGAVEEGRNANAPNSSSVFGTGMAINEGLKERGNKIQNVENRVKTVASDAGEYKDLAAETNANLKRQNDAGWRGALGLYTKGGRRRTRGRKRSRKTRRKGRKQTKRIYIIENMAL